MNDLYPVFLKLAGKKCIVAGGGLVAKNKVEKLLESKASITIISPVLSKDLDALAMKKSLHVLKRKFRKRDLKDAFLVIIATDSRETNQWIANAAREAGILCNVADEPMLCDFYMPAVYQVGDLKIAISTNGKSPAVAKKIKQELSKLYGPEIAEILESLGKLRKKLFERIPDSRERCTILSNLIQKYTFASMGEKDQNEAKKLREEIKKWAS